MRILFLGNNWVAWKVVNWLRGQDEEIVGLVIHPVENRKYGLEIIDSAKVDTSYIFEGPQLCHPDTLQTIKTLRPEIGISVLFGYILQPEFLNIIPGGCVNVHPSLLPYNRGANPNVWSIVEGTPAGVTIHYIDKGIDTGDIIAQQEVHVEPIDTGKSLYRKLEKTCVDFFKETWPRLRDGKAQRRQQHQGIGTYHRAIDVVRIDEIDLDRRYTARELINILRARTFKPYKGAYFWHKDRKVYMSLHLEYAQK
jgi:methionyl-tRNA formyltransferase